MTINDYVAYIKLMLTGSVLTLEVTDDTLKEVVKAGLREVNRYIDQTKFMTIPFARCIDLSGSNVSSVTAIYRTKGYLSSNSDDESTAGDVDPFQATIWKVFSNNGSMYNLNDYVLNYASFATMLSLRSAQTTDLSFRVDMTTKKLYINTSNDVPTSITIEYVPKLIDAEDVVDDFWIDILQRLCLAITKQICGRIRSRYTPAGTLFKQDGEIILAEGNKELEELREVMRQNSGLFYPKD